MALGIVMAMTSALRVVELVRPLGARCVSRGLGHLRVPLYRNAYGITAGAVICAGLGMLYWLLAARYYPPEIVGLSSAAMAAVLFLAGLGQLSLDGALVRFLPRANGAGAPLVRYAYLACGVAAALGAAGFLAGVTIWAPTLSFLTGSLWIALGFTLTAAIVSVLVLQDGALIGLSMVPWMATKNCTVAGAKVLLLVLFAHTSPEYGIVASWLIPSLAAFVPVHYVVSRRVGFRSAPVGIGAAEADGLPSLRTIVRYVAGNHLASLFGLAITQLPPLLVVASVGSRGSAYFYLPWVTTMLLSLLSTSVGTSLTVEGARDGTMLAAYSRQALKQTARLTVPVAAVLLLSAPYLLQIFGTEYAAQGTPLLRLLALAAVPNIVCALYTGIARVKQHLKVIILVQGTSAVLFLGLSYLWLPVYGITAIGMAWLITQTVLCAVLFARLRCFFATDQAEATGTHKGL